VVELAELVAVQRALESIGLVQQHVRLALRSRGRSQGMLVASEQSPGAHLEAEDGAHLS
jgi:hypothetical protein